MEGRKRVAWTPFEESALTRGFAQYGALSNSWALILADSSLGETLKARSNVDLKDKWRNMQKAAARGWGSLPACTVLPIFEQPPKGKRRVSETPGAKPDSSGRGKRARSDAPPPQEAPSFVFVIMKQPCFTVYEASKLDKKTNQAAKLLEALPSEVCGPAYTTAEEANKTAESALVKYLNGTFKEGLAASSADAGGKEKLPPRSLPRRTAHAAASKAPTKAQSASSSSSAVTVSRGPTGGTSYTYQFTKGVFCDGERRKGIGGHVTYSVTQVPLHT